MEMIRSIRLFQSILNPTTSATCHFSFHGLQQGRIHEFLKRVANSVTLLKNIQTPHETVRSLSELAHAKENTKRTRSTRG